MSPIPAAAATIPSRSTPTRRKRGGWRGFQDHGHTPGRWTRRRTKRTNEFPLTLDLRTPPPDHNRGLSARSWGMGMASRTADQDEQGAVAGLRRIAQWIATTAAAARHSRRVDRTPTARRARPGAASSMPLPRCRRPRSSGASPPPTGICARPASPIARPARPPTGCGRSATCR